MAASATVAGKPLAADLGANPKNAHLLFRRHLEQRLGGLQSDRFSWWTHWREIADYLIPRRYKWLITPNQAARGSPINQRIIDWTGGLSLRTLVAGMMSGMTNPTTVWFRLTLDDAELAEYHTVKEYLDEVGKRIRTVMSESNFYTSLGTMYEDLGSFGTGVMIIYEDYDDVIRCYNSCAGEYYLANSNRLTVDTMYRLFVQTTWQIAREFGLANCSTQVKQAMQIKGAGLSREIIVGHSIEPNDELTDYLPELRGRPFREAYWEYGSGQKFLLRVRGFHENPAVVTRWSIFANDSYGRSPAMEALGDLKQLQVEQKRKAQGIDKHVNPPMLADVQLKNEPASLLPGGVTYIQMTGATQGFKPVYEVKPDLTAMIADIKEVQDRIKAAFYYDLFRMWDQMEGVQPRNELEVVERRGEKLIQLGPVLERFENEGLGPAIERIRNIMDRAGLLPPMPRELRGQHVKIEYVSMLAQAQRSAMTTGLEQLASFVGRVSAINPETPDNVDWDEMAQQYGDFTGVSPKIIRPFAKVLEIRAQRAKEKQMAQALQMTSAAVEGAKTMSETNVGAGQSALTHMMGMGS
jgi:hypothetical protein